MLRFRAGTLIMLGVLALGVSAVVLAHIHNHRVEQRRLATLSVSDDVHGSGHRDRGETVARAGGCIACHTNFENDGELLGGGVTFDSPFGTFVSPNISSDPESGIGLWTVDMLAEALLNGRRPDGGHYWPAFPYPAYAAMTGQDIADLYAWLKSINPVSHAPPEHDLMIPDVARVAMGVWKSLYVPDGYAPDTFQERGEYLVEGPAHCAACHAQRDLLGGVSDRRLTGNSRGPEGDSVPAITAEALEDWTVEDLAFFLEIGMTPDGDFSGGHMAKVIEHGTAHLPSTDLQAMAAYLKSPENSAAH